MDVRLLVFSGIQLLLVSSERSGKKQENVALFRQPTPTVLKWLNQSNGIVYINILEEFTKSR